MRDTKLTMDGKVYIVVVNYNSWSDTIECLESILKSDYRHFQVIIVDNDSQDDSIGHMIDWADGRLDTWNGSENVLRSLYYPPARKPVDYTFTDWQQGKSVVDCQLQKLTFVQSGKNGGFAAANNIAIKLAKAQNDFEYIWLLNNDAVIEHDALGNLVRGVEGYSNVGVAGSKILYYSNPEILQNVGSKVVDGVFVNLCKPIIDLSITNKDDGQYDKPFFVDDVMGASMLIKKKTLDVVGDMPEEYFLYGEETDFNFKTKQLGYNLLTIPKSRVYHKKGASTGGSESVLSIYYRTRNQLIFYKKYLPLMAYILYASSYSLIKMCSSYRYDKTKGQAIRKGILHGIAGLDGKSALF